MREPGEETDRAAGTPAASDPPRRTAAAPRDPVDEASEQSFPASDPPAAQPLHPGLPGEHPDHDRGR